MSVSASMACTSARSCCCSLACPEALLMAKAPVPGAATGLASARTRLWARARLRAMRSLAGAGLRVRADWPGPSRCGGGRRRCIWAWSVGETGTAPCCAKALKGSKAWHKRVPINRRAIGRSQGCQDVRVLCECMGVGQSGEAVRPSAAVGLRRTGLVWPGSALWPPATLRSARPALAIEPGSLCKWLWQTRAWVLVEASDGRVLVSVTTAGLLPDRRSRVLAVSQRAWVGATSAEVRLSWPSLRIWLCSHARPEPIGSVVPRAVMVVVSSRPKTWAAKTRRAGQAGCADPSLGGALWSLAGRACRLGAQRDSQTDPFMMSCWLALGNVCRGDRCGRSGGNCLGPAQYIQKYLILLKHYQKFGTHPCSISAQGCARFGMRQATAGMNGGDGLLIAVAVSCSRRPGFSAPPMRRGLPWQRHGPHFGPVAAHVCRLPAPRSALCHHLGPWPGPARGFRCRPCGPDKQGAGRAFRPLEGHCLAAEPDLAGAWPARVRAGRAPPSSGLGCPDPGLSAAGRTGYPERSALAHEAIGRCVGGLCFAWAAGACPHDLC